MTPNAHVLTLFHAFWTQHVWLFRTSQHNHVNTKRTSSYCSDHGASDIVHIIAFRQLCLVGPRRMFALCVRGQSCQTRPWIAVVCCLPRGYSKSPRNRFDHQVRLRARNAANVVGRPSIMRSILIDAMLSDSVFVFCADGNAFKIRIRDGNRLTCAEEGLNYWLYSQ